MQFYTSSGGLVTRYPAPRSPGNTASMRSTIDTRSTPPAQPGRGHLADVASVRHRHGVSPRDLGQRPDPKPRPLRQVPQQEGHDRLTHADNLPKGRVAHDPGAGGEMRGVGPP